jgi:hypothetical protein
MRLVKITFYKEDLMKRILLGLLLVPCVGYAMESDSDSEDSASIEKIYACNYEDDEWIVYSIGNPAKHFKQVKYNKKTKELPVFITLFHGSRTLTIGSKSMYMFGLFKSAYAKIENPISRYEDAERTVYHRRHEQVTHDKKTKVNTLVEFFGGKPFYTSIGSSSDSMFDELKVAHAKQQKEIKAIIGNQ